MATQTLPITGTLVLQSFGLHPSSAPNTPAILLPLGDDPIGRITFTPDSYMSCTLTSREAASPIASPSWILANDEEVLHAARSLVTYCGPFKLYHEDGQTLLSTQVEIALDPTWIGKPQVRKWELRDDVMLVLRPLQNILLPVGCVCVCVMGFGVW